jgi:hypothetical protein
MWALLAQLLPGLLKWFFDGKRIEHGVEVSSPAGLGDLDRDTLSGNADLFPKLLFAGTCLLFLTACPSVNVGGSTETLRIVLVEPAGMLKIATDREIDVLVPVPVKVKPNPLTGQVEQETEWKPGKKNLAGTICMPESVYKELVKKAQEAEALKKQLAELKAR